MGKIGDCVLTTSVFCVFYHSIYYILCFYSTETKVSEDNDSGGAGGDRVISIHYTKKLTWRYSKPSMRSSWFSIQKIVSCQIKSRINQKSTNPKIYQESKRIQSLRHNYTVEKKLRNESHSITQIKAQ